MGKAGGLELAQRLPQFGLGNVEVVKQVLDRSARLDSG